MIAPLCPPALILRHAAIRATAARLRQSVRDFVAIVILVPHGARGSTGASNPLCTLAPVHLLGRAGRPGSLDAWPGAGAIRSATCGAGE